MELKSVEATSDGEAASCRVAPFGFVDEANFDTFAAGHHGTHAV